MSKGGKVAPMKIEIDSKVTLGMGKNDGDARAYVLGNGRRTGHEYLYAYDATSGKVLAMHTDNLPNGVNMPDSLKVVLNEKGRNIMVHHNHPNDLPPSAMDIDSVGKYPGLISAFVHGNGGVSYKIVPLQRGNVLRAIDAIAGTARALARSPEFMKDTGFTSQIEQMSEIMYSDVKRAIESR